MEKTILYCLPYAGGSTNSFTKWKKYLHKSIDFQPIELAGRGKRHNDPFYENIEEAAEDVYQLIKEDIKTSDYAFFGHSMGSLITYELIYKIKNLGDRLPKHIFFSGKKAPHLNTERNDVYLLPDEEFKKEILGLGGTPQEILEHQELVDIFIPLLRADFKIFDTYKYEPKPEKLDCSFTIINGKKDDMTITDITGWRAHTTKDCSIFMLDGGHFYLNDRMEDVTKIINHTLAGS